MILPVINASQIGQLTDASSTDEVSQLLAIYKKLELTCKLPSRDYVTYGEMIAANKGERTLPNIDGVVWKNAVQLVEYESKAQKSLKPHSKMLDSTALRIRISTLCLMKNLPPLMTPKPGCEFEKVYLVYCALKFDQGNLTRWREAKIDSTVTDVPKAFKDITKARENAFTALLTAGLVQNDENINRFTKILRASINFSKLLEDNVFKKLHAKHDEYVEKNLDKVADRCWQIALQCYSNQIRAGNIANQDIFVNQIVNKLKLIFAFDYMLPIHDSTTLSIYDNATVVSAYEEIQKYRAMVVEKDQHAYQCHKALSKEFFEDKSVKLLRKPTLNFTSQAVDGAAAPFGRRLRATGSAAIENASRHSLIQKLKRKRTALPDATVKEVMAAITKKKPDIGKSTGYDLLKAGENKADTTDIIYLSRRPTPASDTLIAGSEPTKKSAQSTPKP